MKIKLVKDSHNQHIVAILCNGEYRRFFINYSLHTASITFENLCRDIEHHGASVVNFGELPKLSLRVGAHGRVIYDTVEMAGKYLLR